MKISRSFLIYDIIGFVLLSYIVPIAISLLPISQNKFKDRFAEIIK